MRVAALDLGSNTFLLLVAELNQEDPPKIIKVIHDEVRVTRISEGLQREKTFTPAALERARKCIVDYSETISRLNAQKVVAVATSAARDAQNKSEFESILNSCGIPFQIITGDMEAQLTYDGATFDLEGSQKDQVVVDIGGGSTEIIGLIDSDKAKGVSLNIGSVRLLERFISTHPVPSRELELLDEYICDEIKKVSDEILHLKGKAMTAVAGTPTTLAALVLEREFEEETIHGLNIEVELIKTWRNKLARLGLDRRLELRGMQSGREDVIVVGLSILFNVAQFLNCKSIRVSTKGVRYGLALNYKLI